MKTKEYSPSVVAIIGTGKKAGPGAAPKAEEEGGESLAPFGRAARKALEAKDDEALGRALKDLIEYCKPESGGEYEAEEK